MKRFSVLAIGVMGFLMLTCAGIQPPTPHPCSQPYPPPKCYPTKTPTAVPTVTAVPTPTEIPMAYRDVVLATRPGDMIAYYELNGNLTDSGPNGLTGAIETSIDYVGGGIHGSQAASSFGLITLGNNFDSRAGTDLIYNAGTINGFARAFSSTSFSSSGDIIRLDASGAYLRVQASAGGVQGWRNVPFYGGNTYAANMFDLVGLNWFMFTMIWDGVDVVLYINGQLVSTAAVGGTSSASPIDSLIGNRNSQTTPWNGDIDEVTFWHEPLTDEEIADLYTAAFSAPASIPIVGTNAVVQIFDRTGVPIGELNPLVDFVSWRRNEIGQAQLTVAKSDPKATDVYLSAQNRVLILFDNGLPPWGGIMQPDFTIEHSTITAKVLTAEILLNGRMTDQGRYFEQQTVGDIATALIGEANAIVPTGLDIGDVWEGGDRHSPEYHYKNLLSIFQESLFSRLSDADFYAEPVVGSDGRLTFTIHISERRGADKPGIALHQGLNVDDAIKVSYQGPVINRWVVIGDGDGWGDSRPTAAADDETSQQRYGILEASEIHQGVTMPATLQAIAENLLAETAYPRVILDITAVDLPPARFAQYWLGDVLTVELPEYGVGSAYVGAASIEAAAFYPSNGRLNLVLRAV